MYYTKDLPLKLEMENREAIKFLKAKGMTARQIRFLAYPRIDPNKKVIYFEKDTKIGKIKKKIHYRGTPVEKIIERPPVSKVWVLYSRIPYRCELRKLPTFLPPECVYSESDIERICGAINFADQDSPLFFQEKTKKFAQFSIDFSEH